MALCEAGYPPGAPLAGMGRGEVGIPDPCGQREPMHILVTGGGGFLGRLLVARLLNDDIDALTVLDTVPVAFDDPRVAVFAGDLADAAWLSGVLAQRPPVDVAFHLAAVVSGTAEADFDLGYRANVDGTRALLEALRRQGAAGGPVAKLVFTSSVAVFGGTLPPVITDATTPFPQSSYGVQKLMCEYMVGDYARKGFVDGRAVRLPTVSVRAGKPNGAASSFASGIIREPLNGEIGVLPVPRSTELWILSPERAVEALRRTPEIPAEAFHAGGFGRGLNLAGVTVSVDEMLDALETVGGKAARALVQEVTDERVARLVAGWPGRFVTERAQALGYEGDASGLAIVQSYARSLTQSV